MAHCLGAHYCNTHLLFFASAQEQIRYTAEMTYLPAGSDIASMGDAGVVLPLRATASFGILRPLHFSRGMSFPQRSQIFIMGFQGRPVFPGTFCSG